MPNPKSEDTQQWTVADIKEAGIKNARTPRPVNQQNTAVQITALIVVFLFAIAILGAATAIAIFAIN